MGFWIKKIITLLINPLTFALFIFLIGLWMLYTNRHKRSKWFLTVSFLLIVLISINPIGNVLLKPLETRYQQLVTVPKDVKYIVLLGGDFVARGWEVLRLYNQKKDVTIITSGFKGSFDIPEAIRNKKRLIRVGVDDDKIIANPNSKDTIEEAQAIKKIVKNDKFILVTSAYHMPRAMMIFQKANLTPIPAPTDFLIKEYKDLLIPNVGHMGLEKTSKAIHEYVGILWLLVR